MTPSISAEEMQSRRQIHEASRHSLMLEGLDEFLSPEAEALSEAWIRGEITLEDAIAKTLQNIRVTSATEPTARSKQSLGNVESRVPPGRTTA